MKIVHIIPKFYLAGAERMVQTLLLEQKKAGHEVYAISLFSFESPITENLNQNGISIYYCNKKEGFDKSLYKKIRIIYKKIQPDIIHTHLYVMKYAIPASFFLNIKGKVHTIHNLAEKECNKKHQLLHKLFFKYNNVIPVAISPIIQKSIERIYGIRKNSIPMIYNGLDLDKCIPKQDYSLKNNTFIFIHIGRFMKQKNHENLIDAFSLMKEKYPFIKMRFLGDGVAMDNMIDKVKKLKLDEDIYFEGIQDDVFKYLKEADVFILPSYFEGMPITLIEAMGSGLPIIASNVGGIPDVIDDGINGILCSTDMNSIALCMERLIIDGNLRKKLGENALKKSIKFSSIMMTKGYIDLYKKLYR